MASALRVAQPSHTESRMATIGVLFMKADMSIVAPQRRSSARRSLRGAPSGAAQMRSAARVSSSAAATTKSAPIARMEADEKPRSASSLLMIRVSIRKVVT